jgi:hypothetical protein
MSILSENKAIPGVWASPKTGMWYARGDYKRYGRYVRITYAINAYLNNGGYREKYSYNDLAVELLIEALQGELTEELRLMYHKELLNPYLKKARLAYNNRNNL